MVFKNFCELSPCIRSFLTDNFKKLVLANYIIFETEKDHYQLSKSKKFTADILFATIIKKAALWKVSSTGKEVSMEDFMSSIRKNDLISSLYILERLFEGGTKEKVLAPQVVGVLVRKCSYLKDLAKKDEYFTYLWEADRAIKEKGLNPRLVIETLLVKLLGPH